MIVVEHLTKAFGRACAVRDVSFRIAPGEVVGLVGPNGSGKTTIIRMLTGFFPPTSGRISVAGVDVQQDAILARERVGYLPESLVLYPDMRVSQFLDFCADVRRLRGLRRRERLEIVTKNCGLREVTHQLIGQLSKGYRQRVGFAQALLSEPPVLILDEPTAGLDPLQVIDIRQVVRSLRDRTTVLLSTHVLAEVSAVCDRAIIINRGQVVVEERVETLTQMFAEAQGILVRVDGPATAVMATLRAVPGVERVEAGAITDGQDHFIVHAGMATSVRPAIAAAVVSHGWGLMEIRPLSMKLEELFVRVLTDRDIRPTS